MSCVYMITGPSGKKYIGCTVRSAATRFSQHWWHATHSTRRTPLWDDMVQHGKAAFSFRVLLVADDRNYLLRMEEMAIARYGTTSPHGYNVSSGGLGATGLPRSVRDRQGQAMARYWDHRREEGTLLDSAFMVASRAVHTDPQKHEAWRNAISAGSRAARVNVGTRNHFAKLTESDVHAIRTLVGSVPQIEIARRYAISPRTVRDIRDRKLWKHL